MYLEKRYKMQQIVPPFSYCYLLGVSLLSLWWETRQFPLSPWNNVQSRSVCLRLVVQHKLWSLRILLQAQWQPISGKCNTSFTIWNTVVLILMSAKFRMNLWGRECIRNLDLRVQLHPGELWVSKQRMHIVLEASKSSGDLPKICGFVHPLHPC